MTNQYFRIKDKEKNKNEFKQRIGTVLNYWIKSKQNIETCVVKDLYTLKYVEIESGELELALSSILTLMSIWWYHRHWFSNLKYWIF